MAKAKSSKQPNILVIWGDDIGYWNISAYNQGMMRKQREWRLEEWNTGRME